MFKIVTDGKIRNKAANYLKQFRCEKRLLATKQEVVSSADVVIIGEFYKKLIYDI